MAKPTPESRLIAALRRERSRYLQIADNCLARDGAALYRETARGVEVAISVAQRWIKNERRRRGR